MKHRMRGALKSLIKLRGLDYDCARERDALGSILYPFTVYLILTRLFRKILLSLK